MPSIAKQILERAIASGLITADQATDIGKTRHARKRSEGVAPAVDELAVELGYLTEEQARRLRVAAERFDLDREIAGYRLIEKIGAGSMGTVYKGKQLSLDRVVAVKVLSPHLAHKPDYVERFLHEARAVARLNHPNVISGIDAGEADGVRYFVMEFASGLTVGQLLDRGGGMDESRVRGIAIQIARALEHAHEAGLVHRDIKPENILLTKNGTAKLCDLGLAKDRPEEGRSLGTPNYISPEQAKGVEDVDIRADLYSFGCTLYHMLAGRVPFEGNAKVVMVQHLSEEPTPLRELEPDVTPGLAAIVARLMQKRATDRYQSPRHLIGALEEYEQALKESRGKPRTPPSRRATRPGPRRRRR